MVDCRSFFLSLLFSLSCFCVLAAPVGLVLSGGGAKGAYEVGVWKAMKEKGVADNVTVISGTSVGALNAALFASEPEQEKIEDVWLKNMRGVMMPNEVWKSNVIDRIERGEHAFSPFEALRRIQEGKSHDGVIDPNALSNILAQCLASEWPKEAAKVYSTSCENGETPKSYLLNDESPGGRIAMLRASSAIPVLFSTVDVNGEVHVDGGCKLNVPIDPIVEKHPEIKTVYVIYLNDEKRLRDDRLDVTKYPNVKIVEIIPSKNLRGWFGALNFSPKQARKLIKLGYDDAMKVLANAEK